MIVKMVRISNMYLNQRLQLSITEGTVTVRFIVLNIGYRISVVLYTRYYDNL